MPTDKNKSDKAKSEGRGWRTIVWWIVFAALVASIIYSIINIFTTPWHIVGPDMGGRMKSDYIQVLSMCLLGVIIMFLPNMIEKKWQVQIPDYMHILYFIFLFCAIYLGEVRDFYYVIPYWDIILHTMSGIMLGALGFLVVKILNDSPHVRLNLSPMFVALFAFCFAVCDTFFGFNMQKFALKDGTLLIGQKALADTMGDLIADSLSALAVSVIGFITLYNGKKERENRKIRHSDKKREKAERKALRKNSK